MKGEFPLNKNIILYSLSIIGIFFVIGILFSNQPVHSSKHSNENTNFSSNQNEVNFSSKNDPASKEIVKLDPYEPDYVPADLKKIEPKQYNLSNAGYSLNIIESAWIDNKPITSPEHKQLLIIQSNDDGSNKPENILNEGEKIMLGDVEAWVLNPALNDPTQIMFWKNNQYFNVRGLNISKEELIKVALSLK